MIRHSKVHCFFDGPKIGESIIYMAIPQLVNFSSGPKH
jgi:hypothetical protein